MSTSITPIESMISVPWGRIAVKAWGNPLGRPVLVLHGIQDNASSFDHLIPTLPPGFYFYCIDLPGHGKSSHFPSGMPLDFFKYVYSIKLVVEHLQWSKFILMGHSLGAQISVFFTALYPEKIQCLILIDGLTPLVINEKSIVPHLRKLFDSCFELEKKLLNSGKSPSYSHNEALSRLMNNRDTQLTKESAQKLLERSLVTSGDGYRFSTDQRLKLRLRPIFTMEQMRNVVISINCPALMVIAKDTYDLIDAVSGELYHERLQNFFVVKPNFSIVIVEGNHDVHMNYPQRVAPYVRDFLLKSVKSSL